MVEGTRSNLAYAFLALVERHRPPAILLENVPGLLSSHGGRDMAALLGRLAELGYGVAYRILDARHFGVPQRRRRVFIVGLRSHPEDAGGRGAAERAAEVLSVGAVCLRHPPAGRDTGSEPARAVARRAVASGELVGALDGTFGHHGSALGGDNLRQGHVIPGVRASVDPGRVRDADGLASGLDNLDRLAPTLLSPSKQGGWRYDADQVESLVYAKVGRAQTSEDGETWREGSVMPTLNSFDVGDVRTTAAIVGTIEDDDPLLPLGLDSHRYRCCGNGVVANVAEWIGRQLLAALGAAA